MRKGLSLIEVIVIFLLIGVAVIYFSLVFCESKIHPGSKTQDIANLRTLVGLYISGQYDGRPSPKSTGHRFWLAMFVGDPESINGGIKYQDIYANASQARCLICPQDFEYSYFDEVEDEFEELFDSGQYGWDKLSKNSNLYTSYAGPRNISVLTDKSNVIVGCDGSRSGYGFYTDGFSVVNNSQGAEFKEYDRLADENPDEWSKNQDEPNWNSELLKTVINIEPAK